MKTKNRICVIHLILSTGLILILTNSCKKDDKTCIPTLLSPENYATLDNGCMDFSDLMTWTFKWESCPGATKYIIFVMQPGSLNPMLNEEVTDTKYISSDISYTMHLFGWIWKVRAFVNGEWGDWSEVRTFDVEPINTDCPLLNP